MISVADQKNRVFHDCCRGKGDLALCAIEVTSRLMIFQNIALSIIWFLHLPLGISLFFVGCFLLVGDSGSALKSVNLLICKAINSI